MVNKVELLNSITEYVNSLTEDISKNEFKTAIGNIYDSSKKSNKKNNETKRPPSKYNLFVKTQMGILKEQNSTLTGKEKMEYIANKWKTEDKSEVKEEKEEVKEEIKEEVKEEVKEVKKTKAKNK